jgi:hypothetical protein
VVLLGQNVNSYWDQEALSSVGWRESRERLRKEEQQQHGGSSSSSRSSSSSSSGGGGQEEGTGTEGAGTGVQQPYAYSIAEGFTQRVRVQSRGTKKAAGEGEGESKVEVEGEGRTEEGVEGSEGDKGGGAVEWQGEGGVRFAELLSLVASIDPDNMRIRFQSPHPKDFPNEVASNLCFIAAKILVYCI